MDDQCGAVVSLRNPPELSPPFESGAYSVSCFDGEQDEQWLFLRNRYTGEMFFYLCHEGGREQLRPTLVYMPSLLKAINRSVLTGVARACLLQELQIVNSCAAGNKPAAMLMLNARGTIILMRPGERLWVHACLLSGDEPPELLRNRETLDNILWQYATSVTLTERLLAEEKDEIDDS